MIPTPKSAGGSEPLFAPELGLQVDDELLARIVAATTGLKFGQISIAVHEGRVVQVDRHQQVRLLRKGEQKPKRESDH